MRHDIDRDLKFPKIGDMPNARQATWYLWHISLLGYLTVQWLISASASVAAPAVFIYLRG